MLSLLLLLATAAPAAAETPDAITHASSTFDGEVGLDFMHASLRSSGGEAMAGAPDSMSAQEAGLRLRFHLEGVGGVQLSPFGGRRAITTSRRQLSLKRNLPAAGLGASSGGARFRVDGAFAYSVDELLLAKGVFDEHKEDHGAANFWIAGNLRPL